MLQACRLQPTDAAPAASARVEIENRVPPQVIMYNTVPDLEASEARPLVAAPPRKHGKAMLAVVAALAFGAGALAPSAAARVSQMKLFQKTACGGPGQKACAEDSQTMSTNGVGGDEVGYNTGVASKDGGSDSGIDIGGTPGTPGTPATPDTPAQEPVGTPICGVPGKPDCAVDAGSLSNGKGGETVGFSTEAQIQGNANANGAAPDTTGQI